MNTTETEDKRICIVHLATGAVIPFDQAVIAPVEFDKDEAICIGVGEQVAPLVDFIMSLCEFMLSQEETDLGAVIDSFMDNRQEEA